MLGNGSRVIHFKTSTSRCGIKTIDELNTYEFQMYLNIRYDRAFERSFDERIFVRCAPQEILLSGSMGRREDGPLSPSYQKALDDRDNTRLSVKTMDEHEFAEAEATIVRQVESKMDVLKGKLPNVKPIEGFVDIGEEVVI